MSLARRIAGLVGWGALTLAAACSPTPPTAPDAELLPPESTPPAPAAPPAVGPDPAQTGRFSGLEGHRAAGTVVFRMENGVGEVSFGDDFSSTPVPDPQVYVATEADANRGVRLRIGPLRSSAGSQTYTFRLTDDAVYRYVLVWCDRYNVGVGAARLP